MRKSLFFLFALVFCSVCIGQTSQYPQNYFRSPFNIPLTTSGTFAELRRNHFHSGIDFRTGQQIGQPIYAVAEGYISRIKVSPWGGGKILYIDHPNGYRSVYMHLNNFEGEIAKYVEKYQYQNQTFELDINTSINELPVTKGQLIAKSGNTGSSGGPHLHFEIRESSTDRAINPLFFGIKFQDNIAPTINKVRVYPFDANSFVNNSNEPFIKINSKNLPQKKGKSIKQNDTINVWGKIYLGINTFDRAINSVGKSGIYKIELFIDNESVYEYCVTDFLFENTRYINILTDYAYYLKNKEFFILTKLPSYTPMPIYRNVKNKGIYDFVDEKNHKIQYKVSDFHGNTSNYTFYLKSVKPENIPNATAVVNDFIYSQKNKFTNPNFQIELDENTLYESIKFEYNVFSKNGNYYSNFIQVANENIPLHKPYKLSITPNNIPQNLKNKAFIASAKGSTFSYEASTWDGNMLTAKPKTFGTFTVLIDTTAPLIKPGNFADNGFFKPQQTTITLKISDNLSGIASYNCFFNGEWILAEYDGKSNTLIISLRNKSILASNILDVKITDLCNNESIVKYTIKKK